MKRVMLYTRCTTVNHGQDPELQLRELRAYCLRMGWEIVGEYVARVTRARPVRTCSRVPLDAENHLMDGIVVWKFDRVARSAIKLSQMSRAA